MKQWRVPKMGRQPIIFDIPPPPENCMKLKKKIGQSASPIPTPSDPPMWTDKDFVVDGAR